MNQVINGDDPAGSDRQPRKDYWHRKAIWLDEHTTSGIGHRYCTKLSPPHADNPYHTTSSNIPVVNISQPASAASQLSIVRGLNGIARYCIIGIPRYYY